VLIELEGERVDLALELTEAPGQAVALFAEGLGQRHHGLDEAVLAILGRRAVAQSAPPERPRCGSKSSAVRRLAPGAHFARPACRRHDALTSRSHIRLSGQGGTPPSEPRARITCGMPIYEYDCGDCRRRVSLLVRSFSAAGSVACPRCGGSRLTRVMSRFATVKSEDARLESLTDSAALGDLDENDPGSVARFMKKMGREFGDDLGDDFESAVDEAMAEGEGQAEAGEERTESVDPPGGSEL
jgi:putative FmdB family regulatory protein